MAEAAGKAHRPARHLFVTRGPGATNASPGVHIALQDSTPMIMFVGQVAREHARARGASGNRLPGACSDPIAKWVTQIDDPARIPELVTRAFHARVERPAGSGGDRVAGGHAARGSR